MAKMPPNQVDELVQQQEADVYGTPYIDGEDADLDSPEEMLKKSIGNDPDEDDDNGFSIADEVEKDEEALEDNEDYESDEPETFMEKQEKLSSDEDDFGDDE